VPIRFWSRKDGCIGHIYTVSRKKGATVFFAVTFTNIDGFSKFFVHNFKRE